MGRGSLETIYLVAVAICTVLAALSVFYLEWQARRHRYRGSPAQKPSPAGKTSRWATLLGAALFLFISPVYIFKVLRTPGANLVELLLPIFGIVAGLCFYFLVSRSVARCELRRQQFSESSLGHLVDSELPATPPSNNKPPAARLNWGILAIVVVLVALLMAIQGGHVPRLRWIPLRSGFAQAVLTGGLFLVVLCALWIQIFRQSGPSRRASQLARDGDIDGAIALLEAERARRGDYDFVLNDLALLYAEKKDFAKALDLIDAQIAARPDVSLVYNNRAVYLLRLGRLEEAEQAFRKIGPAVSDDSVFLGNYAELLIDLGRTEEAAAMIEQAQRALDGARFLSHEGRQARADEIYRLRMRLPPHLTQ